MLGVLVILFIFFSVITFEEQQPVGIDAADQLIAQIVSDYEKAGSVIIAGKNNEDGRDFVGHLKSKLKHMGWHVEAAVAGSPIDLGTVSYTHLTLPTNREV